MKRVPSHYSYSVVTITGLRPSQHYRVMVETCIVSGVITSHNATIGVKTLSADDDVHGSVTVLSILVGVLVTAIVVIGPIYVISRYFIPSQLCCCLFLPFLCFFPVAGLLLAQEVVFCNRLIFIRWFSCACGRDRRWRRHVCRCLE